jgi:hypothetical protein
MRPVRHPGRQRAVQASAHSRRGRVSADATARARGGA